MQVDLQQPWQIRQLFRKYVMQENKDNIYTIGTESSNVWYLN
jgi:hypothetical protein